jgi:hypothetical protein
MMHRPALLLHCVLGMLAASFFSSCATFGISLPGNAAAGNGGMFGAPSAGGDFWNTAPSNGALVFIGGAVNGLTEDETIAAALRDAARKVAFYHGISGEMQTYVDDTGSPFTFSSDVQAAFSFERDYDKYLPDLKFNKDTDILRGLNSLFVKARYAPSAPLELRYSRTAGQPKWLMNPPAFPGYAVGVGHALATGYQADTLRSSTEKAVIAVFNKVNPSVGSDQQTIETSSYSAARTLSIQTSSGSITNFYVLDTWEDPKDSSVWTLAVAKVE